MTAARVRGVCLRTVAGHRPRGACLMCAAGEGWGEKAPSLHGHCRTPTKTSRRIGSTRRGALCNNSLWNERDNPNRKNR